MNTNIQFVFFGTPKLATIVLDELKKRDLLPALVVTAPDRPAGRGMQVAASPVKEWAQKHNIPTIEPETFDARAVERIQSVSADVFVLAAYGKILPQTIITMPALGILNVHPSLLPKLRGPSPIRSAIREDHRTVGVSIMLLDEKMDHGPILKQEEYTPAVWPPSAQELGDYLFLRGGSLLADVLPAYIQGEVTAIPQDDAKATYCHLFKKEDGELHFDDDPYTNLLKIHAYQGWPGTYFFTETGVRVKVISAHMENTSLIIDEVVPEGKNKMSYTDFISKSEASS
tara:strand:+ start:26325 stop:27182 length:858 start_codon:yes stop_codon:yes gene_type:complete